MLSQVFRGHFQQQRPRAAQGHFPPLPPRPAAVPLGFDSYRSSRNTILPGSKCLQQGEGSGSKKSGSWWTEVPPCPRQPPEGPAGPAWASAAAPAGPAAPELTVTLLSVTQEPETSCSLFISLAAWHCHQVLSPSLSPEADEPFWISAGWTEGDGRSYSPIYLLRSLPIKHFQNI